MKKINSYLLIVTLFFAISQINGQTLNNKLDNKSDEYLSISNLSLNTPIGPGETLGYSFTVNGYLLGEISKIIPPVEITGYWLTVSITFSDGTGEYLINQMYIATGNIVRNFTGEYVIPEKHGNVTFEVTVRKCTDNTMYLSPSDTESLNFKIEYITISEITLNKNTFIENENLEYSFDVSGYLDLELTKDNPKIPNIDAGFWIQIKVQFEDGSNYIVLDQINYITNSFFSKIISGIYVIPSKVGSATLNVQIMKYAHSSIYTYPDPVINSKEFTIEGLTTGTADISNAVYANSIVNETNKWTLYWGEEYNIYFDITNSGETDVDVKTYSIYSPVNIDEEEMIDGDYINSTYFKSPYIMDSYEKGIIEPGQTSSTVLFTDFNSVGTRNNYNLWIFTCKKDDNKVLDKKKKEIYYYPITRPSKILPLKSQNNSFLNSDIKIFPNPTTGKIYLKSNEDLTNSKIEVFSLNGVKVISESIKDPENIINIDKLENGLYIIQIKKDIILYQVKIQILK